MASQRRRDLLEAGAKAPDFRLARLEGGEVSLAELTAKGPVALAFFKITCPVCQMTLPFLERIHAAAPGALAIYGISQNGPRDTRDFARQYRVRFPLLLDTEESGFAVSNAYGISSVPTIFVVERDGSISAVSEGWSRRDIESLGERAGVKAVRPGDNVPEWKAG
jgi:peroxiredoxin